MKLFDSEHIYMKYIDGMVRVESMKCPFNDLPTGEIYYLRDNGDVMVVVLIENKL